MRNNIKYYYYSLIYSRFKKTKIKKSLVAFSAKIESSKKAVVNIGKVTLNPNVTIRVRENGELKIGDGSFFNNGCILTCRKKINIGKNVGIRT